MQPTKELKQKLLESLTEKNIGITGFKSTDGDIYVEYDKIEITMDKVIFYCNKIPIFVIYFRFKLELNDYTTITITDMRGAIKMELT